MTDVSDDSHCDGASNKATKQLRKQVLSKLNP